MATTKQKDRLAELRRDLESTEKRIAEETEFLLLLKASRLEIKVQIAKQERRAKQGSAAPRADSQRPGSN